MNSALLLLNAIALAVVVAFHFQADGSADQLASTSAHYTHHQPPKPAALDDHALESARNARDIQVEQPSSQPSQSWLF